MRCFVALRPPEDFVRKAGALIAGLALSLDGWRWVRSEGLHMTVAFLGDTGSEGIELALRALRQTAAQVKRECSPACAPAFSFRRLGAFPGRSRPRVLVLEPEREERSEPLWRSFNGLLARYADEAGAANPNAEWPPGRP